MKMFWTIVFILLIALIVIMAYVGYSAYIAVKLIKTITGNELRENIESVKNGDCERLPELESRASNIKSGVTKACNNLVLRKVASKYDVDSICKSSNPEAEVDKLLNEARTTCAERSIGSSLESN